MGDLLVALSRAIEATPLVARGAVILKKVCGVLVILARPLTILWIAVPLFIQTNLIFWLTYGLAKFLKLSYINSAPAAMIGASNHFEVAIATATMLFGLASGAALATVVGVLIEVPVMLALVAICQRTRNWFPESEPAVGTKQQLCQRR